jgi:hypothetical protein
MVPSRTKTFPVLLALTLGAAILPALADDACVDFKWDVSKERALFAETPAELTAGKDSVSAPIVVPNRLYTLRLMTQPQVAFPATPGKKVPTPSAYAGLATLKIPAAGSYRIAVDLPVWIDVVSNGTLVQPTDYEGQHHCSAPHKIVEFSLAGGQPFVLQISNAVEDHVLLTVTPSPPRKL